MTSLRSYFAQAALVCAVLAVTAPAFAQEERITVGINFGVQAGSGDFGQRLTPLVYDEPAVFDIAQDYDGGALVDVGGTVLLFGNIGAGASYSRSGGDGTAVIAAQVPHPLIFDALRSTSATLGGLDHTENAVHLQVVYRYAVTPKLDVTVGLGPTFFTVRQALITAVDVSESGSNPVIAPRATEISDSAVGFNIGADLMYVLRPRFGVGALLRYSRGSAEYTIPDSSTVDVDAGGLHFGVGARVRF
jgi:opacity protein-like surface antigen